MFHCTDTKRLFLSFPKCFGRPYLNPFLSHFFRKQCIELEQQFDFLKDLVASVPDMQGDGEDNHVDGDKGPRRWVAKTRYTSGEGHKGWGWLGVNQEESPRGRWTVPSRRGRKPGSSGRKNGGTGSKGKDKKLSGTDSEQEVSEADG